VSPREATQNPGRATPIPRRATHVRPRVAHLPRSPRNRSLLLRSPQPRNCAGKCGRKRRCPPQRWQGPRPTHPCVPARAGKGVGCVGNTFAGPCNTFPGSGNTFPGSGGTFREGASALHLAAGPADGHRKTPANDRHLTVRRRCAAETAALRTLRRRPRPGSARHTGPRNRPPPPRCRAPGCPAWCGRPDPEARLPVSSGLPISSAGHAQPPGWQRPPSPPGIRHAPAAPALRRPFPRDCGSPASSGATHLPVWPTWFVRLVPPLLRPLVTLFRESRGVAGAPQAALVQARTRSGPAPRARRPACGARPAGRLPFPSHVPADTVGKHEGCAGHSLPADGSDRRAGGLEPRPRPSRRWGWRRPG
jgi:hypothetical protein